MEKLTSFIEKKIAPIANKLGRQKYIQALQNSFLALIPFITVGSLALVIISPPMDYATMDPGVLRAIMHGWAKIADFTGPTLGFINMVTMSMMALYIAIGMGLNLAKQYKMSSFMPTLVTTMTFLICATMNADGELTVAHLDGTGLFTAIIVSILSFELYRKLVEKGVGHIDLSGAGIPPALLDSLGNLVPVVIVLIVFGAISQIIMTITGSAFPELMTIIMTPLVNMVDSIWGVILLAVIVMLFWWFGIHDSVITGPLDVFLMSNYTANMTAFAAGTAAASLPFIVTEPFWWTFMTIGGSGATLGLAFLAATSKSKQIKTVGRLAIIPSLFNINEPLIFGLPIMYNPTMLIPFVVAMPLNGVITYICMSTGLVAKTFSYASWNMFCPIGGFIATLDVKALILICALIVIDVLIYLPFFKVYEKQKLKEEASIETLEE